jgi:hypothetical protein
MYIDLQINYAPGESQRDHKNGSVDSKAITQAATRKKNSTLKIF